MGTVASTGRATLDEDRSSRRRQRRRSRRWQRFGRPLLLVGLIGTAWALGARFGVGQYLNKEHIEALVSHAGWWGPLAFIAIFALGELLHVPGLVFVAAAVLAWGRWPGIAAAFVGAVLSAIVGFLVARFVGGKPLHHPRMRWLKGQLDRLDRRPVLTVTVLRMIFWMAPPLNYLLGMTGMRLRDYALGTAIGLAPALLVTGLFFDWIVRTLL